MTESYILPSWFTYNYFDWQRCYAKKYNKEIISEKDYIDNNNYYSKMSKQTYLQHMNKPYIVSTELYERFEILRIYLWKSYNKIDYDWSSEEAKELLDIRIGDYDWYFIDYHGYDKESDDFLFSKIVYF